MPGSLDKTRKQIAKKRGGTINALHAKSRDSLRLHKAGVRDQRIEKLARSRSKKERPLSEFIYFLIFNFPHTRNVNLENIFTDT